MEMQQAGVSVEDFLEFAKRDPAAAKILGEQLKKLIDSGASQKEVADFFNGQAKGSGMIADITENSSDWKHQLARIYPRRVN